VNTGTLVVISYFVCAWSSRCFYSLGTILEEFFALSTKDSKYISTQHCSNRTFTHIWNHCIATLKVDLKLPNGYWNQPHEHVCDAKSCCVSQKSLCLSRHALVISHTVSYSVHNWLSVTLICMKLNFLSIPNATILLHFYHTSCSVWFKHCSCCTSTCIHNATVSMFAALW